MKLRALSERAPYPDPAIVLADDPMADCQAQAGPLADCPGGEERIKNPLLDLLRDAAAVIAYGDQDCLPLDTAGQNQLAFAMSGPHGRFGIDDQVQQDLLELLRVSHRGWKLGIQLQPDTDVPGPQRVGAQGQGGAHQLVQVNRRSLRFLLPGESEQSLNDAGHALGGAYDLRYGFVRSHRQRLQAKYFAVADDRRQRVVDLVGDT